MSGNEFLGSLPPFSEFSEVVADEHFVPVPKDWFVVVTDIQGSTVAIDEGRYKDVNTVGAACIVAAQNALRRQEFLYVFGGDGATLVLAPEQLPPVARALAALARLSEENFGLKLRVGAVPLHEVYAAGVTLEAARFELRGGKTISMFRGGGLSFADRRVKDQPDRYGVTPPGPAPSNLNGLSCRWQPIPSLRGQVMSLLVVAQAEPHREVYEKTLQHLHQVFDGDLSTANPVHIENMAYRTASQNATDERRYHPTRWGLAWLWRWFEILIAGLIYRHGVHPLFFNPKRYAVSMATHSDFRKFDDGLKMVLDCTPTQIDEVRNYLKAEHRSGQLRYGIHLADQALMTCFVYNLNDGGHIHFVDGGDGGYAMAAKQLKAQA